MGWIKKVCILVMIQMVLLVECQENDDFNTSDPTVMKRLTELANHRISAVTSDLIHTQVAHKATFCVTDPEEEWNKSFNYSSNLDFLSKCITQTQGDLAQRLCSAAELKFYFTNFIANTRSAASFLKPNRNCNSTTWVSGCEPGWACTLGTNQPPTLTQSQQIPVRTYNCQPCCEGFFCPQGLTCMIPCPLGAHCPRGIHNALTGLCDPYMYQLPLGLPNHTCGGANIWADVSRGGSMFCSAGSYCPTNTQKIPCFSRHYCRMGSTSETRCYRLTSCNANTTRQNISQYGCMLIVGISVMLFVFYNCYGKVITIRERRYARSRETAVKSMKESARAQARWLAAVETIRRRAAEISHSFSRRNIILPDDLQLGDVSGVEAYPQEQEIEEFPEHVDPETGDRDHNEVKVKHIRTDTQIFKYAYSQLERERAVSGVSSMTMVSVMRKRPTIEIAFRDLTVTLKQKKICLLRSANGEILPGRITAVMGPSGAGKTTMLSALAGKTVGCSVSGLVLINGQVESIRSYKKIVGFVPQDDVVHGNLTVEENIWFSANCRLSAVLPKVEKVLIVERVIESLGLQPVRSSLVGTVEKRGISGGQRKRVNVGLELVVEPSLLFLDEPTSGLDSSSSQLLLRALKREALEGVNICAVVHQPSYSLFNMFDDLILLAKGGLTAYHGEVRDVEGYFAGLGINVPDRINPPDYFIDILEGMVKPHTSTGVTYEELPLRWKLHKGHPVPPDMQRTVSGVGVPATNANSRNQENLEFMHNLKYRVEALLDVVGNTLFKPKDLSRRQTPSILAQYRHFLARVAKQRLREARIQAIDYLILLLAGAFMGLIAKSRDENFGAPGYTYTIIATSLLCKITALRTFSLDKLQYRRERASGISSLAHFVAKDTTDHFNTLIKPLVYLSMFYFFSNPRSTFLDNYIVLLCLVYCVTGVAYTLAIFLEPGPSQLCSVLLPVVLTLLSTQPKDSQFNKILTRLCYPSWALEAFIVSNAKSYHGVWLIQRCGALLKMGYNLHNWTLCISLLIATGAGCRVFAFIGMLALQNK
ncbi:ABC transporter G family member 24-like [Salvia divinorum]|uniref:ABC transporter G family member 24-like n=1 Tax=Salvia divinorum TaxID=28513 RepID=A0ABD1HD86_SALDI